MLSSQKSSRDIEVWSLSEFCTGEADGLRLEFVSSSTFPSSGEQSEGEATAYPLQLKGETELVPTTGQNRVSLPQIDQTC